MHKSICPFPIFDSQDPKIKKGETNELCSMCGINISIDEEYLVWVDKRKYCLHCVMTKLRDIESCYDNVPNEFKEEWKLYGKSKCTKKLKNIT